MIAIRVAAAELRRLTTGTLPKLAVLALVVVPSLYSGLYLFANDDPYGRLDQVPAALVVQDLGATTAGGEGHPAREVHYGDEVARRLVDGDGGFGWTRTSQTDAEAGIRSGRYDSALVIGPSFSEDLVSAGKFEPRQASLTLITNDANNYMATTIADTIVGKVRDAIAEEVGTEAATTFLRGFASIHTNLASGVEGAERLVKGADKLVAGTKQAVTGTRELATGATEASNGTVRLRSGADELASGAGRLTSGATELSSGLGTLATRTRDLPVQTRRLADGAGRVAAGNEEVAAVGRRVAEVTGDVLRQLDEADAALRRRVQELVDDGVLTPAQGRDLLAVLDVARAPVQQAGRDVRQASNRLDKLSAGSGEVAAGAQRLADATPELVRGIDSARAGAGRLQDGAAQLDSGAGRLSTGVDSLASGTAQLATGADRLARGSVRLRDGSIRLRNGTAELRTGLREGLGKVPNPDARTERATARTIGNPVRVADDALARAGNYGAGLAPFFMSLAAWIGAYVLFLLVKPLSTRPTAAGAAPWQTTFGGWIPAGIIGAVQVLVMFVLVKFALGIDVVHPVATVLLLLLASAAFVAVIQALNVWLGAVGQFLGLVLMLVQLVTAGGTFPWQTVPEPLRSFHQILPMSYAVEGLRQTLYGGDGQTFTIDVAVLVGVLLVALAFTTWGARRQRTWTITRLQPELVL